MMEKKEYRGVQVNHAMFQGTIIEDPIFSGDYIFLKLRTVNKGFDANGQYTETDQIVPLMIEPNGPVRVAKEHIATGRQLLAWTSYKSWVLDGTEYHSFVVKSIDLGTKPYVPQKEATPPLPR